MRRWLTLALTLIGIIAAQTAFAADPLPAPVLSVRQMQDGGYVSDLGGRLVKEPNLKISFVPLFESFRSQAPLNVMVRLQWSGKGLLNGRLLCDIYADQNYVGSWRSPEVTVSEDVLVFPLMLPPSPLYDERNPYTLRIVFQTANQTIEMDPRDLPVESAWAREFIVGVFVPDASTRIAGFKSSIQTPQIGDVFQLAAFHDDRKYNAQLIVNTVPVSTKDVPVDPLRLTAFDLVIVSAESLRELRPAQLESLSTWIRAGGRACVVATSAVPTALRKLWTNLLNERPEDPQALFDEKGRMRLQDGTTQLRVRPGCGRVLCLTEAVDIESAAWREQVLWLYGVREQCVAEIRKNGTWKLPASPPPGNPSHPFVPEQRPIGALREPLRPAEVGSVSMTSVLLILATCLALIGPVDYYVLGRLGARKWTWVFLPAVAIAATWFTMRISQSSLGGNSYSKSLSIADLDRDGNVVRVSRIEQVFSGTETVRTATPGSAFRVDFERPLLGWDGSPTPLLPYEGSRSDGESNFPPVRYSGRVSGSYEVAEPMLQWVTRLFRETTFGPDPRVKSDAMAKIDWRAIESIDWSTPEHRATICEHIAKVLPDAIVYLRSGLETIECAETPSPGGFVIQGGVQLPPDDPRSLIRVVATATSCPRVYPFRRSIVPHGLFGLVRERSPTCGPDLEDLAWIDSEDGSEAVLLISIPGNDTVIFRRRLTHPGLSSIPGPASVAP